MKIILSLLLFLLTISSVSTQRSVVSGEFLYQKNEKFKIQTIDNPLFESFATLIDTMSDVKGKFHVEFQISQPQFVYFRSSHGLFRIFIRPDETLYIKMLNKWSMEFGGGTAVENNWLFQHKFLESKITTLPNDMIWSDIKQVAQLEFEDNLKSLDSLKRNATDVFYQFAYSEILAQKYLTWLAIRNLKSQNLDMEAQYYLDSQLKKFYEEDVIDTGYSKSYLSLVFYLKKYLHVLSKDNITELHSCWSRIQNDTIQSLLQYYVKKPILQQQLQFVCANFIIGQIFDSLGIEEIIPVVQHLSQLYPSAPSTTFINEHLSVKKRIFLVTKLIDFKLWNEQKEEVLVSSLLDSITRIEFSDLKRVKMMEENDKRMIESYKLFYSVSYPKKNIGIIIGETFEDWWAFFQKNKTTLHKPYYFLPAQEAERVKKDYFFNEIPFSFDVLKNQKINHMISSYSFFYRRE